MDSTRTTLTYNCRTKRLELGVRLTIRGSLPTSYFISFFSRLTERSTIIAKIFDFSYISDITLFVGL